MDSVQIESRAEWRAWLQKHHQRTQGIWLITWKKASGSRHVSYDDVVEEALCFGWIDSKPGKVDEQRTRLWLSPRKSGSAWSLVNKNRIERAIAAGLMTAAGLAKIEAAKLDGSWNALDAVDALQIPDDLAAALSKHKAASNFEAFPKSAKRGILEWIGNAKTAATRAKRVEETARLAAINERANQWKPKKPAT
jgi:uncharacterized protein YdeI (YjbR/CyaY-like superfamily)